LEPKINGLCPLQVFFAQRSNLYTPRFITKLIHRFCMEGGVSDVLRGIPSLKQIFEEKYVFQYV